ncbi:MAG TPA: response regulator [Candidatus Udaeobacter sp.]|nr:response regulator [Candidatus Udaeobacter sp.]
MVTVSGPRSVLVVDDDDALRQILEERLRSEGFEVRSAPDGLHGYSCYFQYPTELVVTDVQMPELDGLQMMRAIRAINPSVKAIYLTGATEQFRFPLELERQKFGAAVLSKPFSTESFMALIGCGPAEVTEGESKKSV